MYRFFYIFSIATILANTTIGAPSVEKKGDVSSKLESAYQQISEKYGDGALAEDYSDIEKVLVKENQIELANLVRELRLQNPYPKGSKQYQLWWEQAQLNVPVLILSSIFLDEMCRKENIKKILFSQRDCFHWIKIFKKLFPDYDSIDFMTSREAYLRPTPEYIEYVANLCKDKFIIVDGQGSGSTCLEFFQKQFHSYPLHLAIVRSGPLCFGIVRFRKNVYKSNIEKVNYAPYGSLLKLNSDGPVRAKLEYPIELIDPAIACVARAIERLEPGCFRIYNKTVMNALISALNGYKPVLAPYRVLYHATGSNKPPPKTSNNSPS